MKKTIKTTGRLVLAILLVAAFVAVYYIGASRQTSAEASPQVMIQEIEVSKEITDRLKDAGLGGGFALIETIYEKKTN